MIKPPLVTFCSILGLFTIGPVFTGSAAAAVSGSVQGVADNEVVRREDALARAHEAIVVGGKAMKAGDYDTAVTQYKAAVDFLSPESRATRSLRQSALGDFSDASVRLAAARIKQGKYAEATAVIRVVLDPSYNPRCYEATQLLLHLNTPDYFNKTITPKFYANVEQVHQWLIDAQQFADTGRYDLAEKRYEQVLNIDPYNTSARKGLEAVDNAKYHYAIEGYDETRSHALWELESKWERPVHKYGLAYGSKEMNPQMQNNNAAIVAKLNRINIPQVEFKDATVREAIDFLKKKSIELDVNEPDPTRRGVNIVLQLETTPSVPALPTVPAPAPAATGTEGAAPAALPTTEAPAAPVTNPNDARITLSLRNLPLSEVLRYVTLQAGLKVKIDQWAVAIVPITESVDALITKEYNVPPGFISNAPSAGSSTANLSAPTSGAGGLGATPGTGDKTVGTVATHMRAQDFLASQGVQFPPNASANFIPSSSKLIVRNTQDNLDLIDSLVEAASTLLKQVEIEAKFVDIQQTNNNELSFDWLLGQMQFSTSPKALIQNVSGGTAGNQTPVNQANYPFTIAGTGEAPVTAGLRSGGDAISNDAIDSLLFPATGATTQAPAVIGISGVIEGANYQMVIRALNQKKGVDLLCAPRVTTKSGQRATVEIIREFRYPTEFNPPQIPQTICSSGAGGYIPVTPTTPTAFETRNTGVTLEVEPVIGNDGATIDLNLVPQVVEFEGFINYGSPIMGPLPDATMLNPNPSQPVLTANVINQPVFSTRKVTTSVSIWDGQTVVLGGLVREDVQKVEDKVPFLGDIPFLGRAFRSSVDQHIKDNLVIFVSARLINPAGEPINESDAVKEDPVDAVALPAALPEGGALPAMLPTTAPSTGR